jgi:hypothetical protein
LNDHQSGESESLVVSKLARQVSRDEEIDALVQQMVAVVVPAFDHRGLATPTHPHGQDPSLFQHRYHVRKVIEIEIGTRVVSGNRIAIDTPEVASGGELDFCPGSEIRS